MPLYGASKGDQKKPPPGQKEAPGWMNGSSTTDEEGGALSLTRLCLLSLADNMNTVWVKDYADKYLNHYLFRHIMGPFNVLCADLVEDLIKLLCLKKKLSRAALDLLLVPQLRTLSLPNCPGLVTPAVCDQIAARCQLLSSLDFSGAQQLSSKVLSQTFSSLTKVRFLSLAGTNTDKSVLRVIVQNLPLLCQLDISQCHLVSPTDLLLLTSVSSHTSCPSTSTSCVNSSSVIAAGPPLPLNSLLALDIGFEEQNGDAVAVAAYLLLTLSSLEKLAVEGIAQACQLILHERFDQTDMFSLKHEVASLKAVWMQGHALDFSKGEDGLKNCYLQENNQFTLRLKDVNILSCESLESLGHLCPEISSVSINADYPHTIQTAEVTHLTKALKSFSGQLKRLSLQYSDFLLNLVDTVCVVGSSLLSLTLEGVKTNRSSYSSLLTILQACPKLRELSLSLEPFHSFALDIAPNRPIDWNRLHLPDLHRLSLQFSYDHSQMKPHITQSSLLTTIIACLLAHSSRLQNVSLISLPCPLNCVFRELVRRVNWNQFDSSPLRCLQHLDLQRTDVRMDTVNDLICQCKRLNFVNISFCWNISQSEWINKVRSGKVEVVWM
ncbi:uncharacterized protein [Eucyclogobius newberryi]|uniref:uncharacterized protein n=1 Tax=Eucyclogobius newberryi TaxID=166745 RepID=UPI003B58FE1F